MKNGKRELTTGLAAAAFAAASLGGAAAVAQTTAPTPSSSAAPPAAAAKPKTIPMMGMGRPKTAAVAGGNLGAPVATVELTLDNQALTPEEMRKRAMMYHPAGIKLSTEKPAGIVREPKYGGTPRYGTVSVGNGPNRSTFVVVDDKADGGGKLYVDSNRNGDLTDDGDGAWAGENRTKEGIVSYATTQRLLRASWADPKSPATETSTGPYTIGFYYREGYENLFFYRQTARVGLLALDGQKVPIMLIDNDTDAVYDPKAKVPIPGSASQQNVSPWLLFNDGSAGPIAPGVAQQEVDADKPFKLNGKVYEVRVTPDGSKLTLYPSDAKMPDPPKLPPMPGLLAVGQPAPDFTVDLPGGSKTSLAALKGKVVVLDFWATWCGPCQRSMPHLEGIYRQVAKGADATVLAVCVADARSAFDKWSAANMGKNYTFPIAFDPAAQDRTKEISRNKYGVTGIPTQFVIDKDGKIAASIVGYGGDGDHRLEEALNKLGVKVAAPAGAPVAQTSSAK